MESTIPSSRSRRDLTTWVGQVSLLVVFYVIAGLFGLELTHFHDKATLVWPPTGLSLAALIVFGTRLWPGVFIGSLLLNMSTTLGWVPALGIAAGNTLEAVVGAFLLVRVAGFRLNFERQRDFANFILIGVLGCTTISATLGAGSLLFSGGVEAADFGQVWLIWWLGHAAGALIMTPLLLISVYGTPSWGSLVRRFESWSVLTLVLTTTLFGFFAPGLGKLGFAACTAPLPVLIWAGTRLGPRGAVVASFLTVLIATLATGVGSGPLVLGTTTEAMTLLWSYATLMGAAAFTLATIVEQRGVADRRYRSEEAERLRIEKQKLLLLERERVTREMHDGLGGQLVSALSMVERGLADSDEVAERIRRAIDDVRIVIDSLDPETTDLPISLGKLRARLEPLLRRNGIDLRWSVEDISGFDAFPPDAALHVLRIIQEAVTNALRHADADSVEVKFRAGSGRLLVSIQDDGRGLSPQIASGGRGIKNMQARAEELGAVLRIEGSRSGTQVDLLVPFPR